MTHHERAEDFIRAWYRMLKHTHGGVTELRMFETATRGTRKVHQAVATEDEFVRVVMAHRDTHDVYAGIGERRPGFVPTRQRSGRSEDVRWISAYAFDVDGREEGPDGRVTQRGLDEARRIKDRILAIFERRGYNPPAVIFSGGGWHLWWTFPTQHLRTAAEREAFLARLVPFVKTIRDEANAGISEEIARADPIYDLPRILRVAGTLNHGEGRAFVIPETSLKRRPDRVLLRDLKATPLEAKPRPRESSRGTMGTRIAKPQPIPLANGRFLIPLPPRRLSWLLRNLDAKNKSVEAALRGEHLPGKDGHETEAKLVEFGTWSGMSDYQLDRMMRLANVLSNFTRRPKWAHESEHYHERSIATARRDIENPDAQRTRYRWQYAMDGRPLHHGNGGDCVEGTLAEWDEEAWDAALAAFEADLAAFRDEKPVEPVSVPSGRFVFEPFKPKELDGAPLQLVTLRQGVTVFRYERPCNDAERKAVRELQRRRHDKWRHSNVPIKVRLLRLPDAHEMRREFPADCAREADGSPAILCLGRSKEATPTSSHAWDSMQRSLAEAGTDLSGEDCMYVIAWRRGSRRAWYDWLFTHDADLARSLARIENDDAAALAAFPERYFAKQKAHAKTRRREVRERDHFIQTAGLPDAPILVNGVLTFE